MKRRILTTALALALVLGLAPALTPAAGAAFSTGYPNTYVNTGNYAADIVGVAETQVGYAETAPDNTKYNYWYYDQIDRSDPWCGIFVAWCANKAGVPSSIVAQSGIAYVGGLNESNMQKNPFGAPACTISEQSPPQAGDIAFIDNQRDGRSHHVGLVSGVDGSHIYTIEGNFDHKVSRVTYSLNSGIKSSGTSYAKILFVARPNYGGAVVPSPYTPPASGCSCSTSYAGNYLCTSRTTLKIRTGHGTSYGVAGSIPGGATVYVLKANGSWAHVTYNGVSGYASMSYLSRQTDNSGNVSDPVETGGGEPATRSPVIYLDEARCTGVGRVYVRGWAYDPDNAGASLAVHIYTGTQFLGALTANGLRQDADDVWHCGAYHGFEGTLTTVLSGPREISAAALDAGADSPGWAANRPTVDITPDTTPPVISKVTVTGVSAAGYTVSVTASDDLGVTSVRMPTWYQWVNEMPDANWYSAAASGSTWSYTVPRGGTETYYTDLYVYDGSGNSSTARIVVGDRTVTFDPHGGTCGMTSKTVIGVYSEAPGFTSAGNTYGALPFPSRAGYAFAGWYTAASGGTKVTPASLASLRADQTLYAHWTGTANASPAASLEWNGRRYERFDLSLRWTDAEAFCEARGGHLAAVTSAAEQAQLCQLIAGGSKNLYYLGATDSETEGVWKWVSLEPFRYENWDKGFPEPSSAAGENYAAVMAVDVAPAKTVGEWIDTVDAAAGGNAYDAANAGLICEYGPASGKPVMVLEEAAPAGAGQLYVKGWAYDPDRPASAVPVHVYTGSTFLGALTADAARADVDAVHGCGANHGFAGVLDVGVSGTVEISAASLDLTGDGNTWAENRPNVTIVSKQTKPVIVLDEASSPGPGKLYVRGWAYDPDRIDAAVPVHVYTGSTFLGSFRADKTRTDVDSARHCGPNHGFEGTVDVGVSGTVEISAASLDLTGDGNTWASNRPKVTIAPETVKPEIQRVSVTDVSAAGYTVTVGASDNIGVTSVRMPTWYRWVNDSPDAAWYTAAETDAGWTYRIDRIAGQSPYYTDVYVYDGAGNYTTARITVGEYAVTFDPRGGTCAETGKTVTGAYCALAGTVYGGNVYGALPTPTREGHRFDGWYTAASGGERVTAESPAAIRAAQTLYAHWTQDGPSITAQPQDVTVAKAGDKASFTVSAQGSDLTYAWYYRNLGASKWTKSSTTGTKFTLIISQDREVKCEVTGSGTTVTSGVAKGLVPDNTILNILPDVTQVANPSDKVSFQVTGGTAPYTWYYRNAGAAKWSRSAVTGNKFSLVVSRDREAYCVSADGKQSAVATASVASEGVVQVTPATAVAAKAGGRVTFTASGGSAPYAWYYRNAGALTWTKSSVTTNKFSILAGKDREVFCASGGDRSPVVRATVSK